MAIKIQPLNHLLITTQLRPVVQLLFPNNPAGKQGATHQAGMGAQALPRAATTTTCPCTLSCCPWTQVRPWQLLVPTTKKQNDSWRQVIACPRTHPSSLPIPGVEDMAGQLEVSNDKGSKHPRVSQILLPLPWRVGTRFAS